MKRVSLQFGDGNLEVAIPSDHVTVLEPAQVPGLSDERGSFLHALNHPIGCAGLRSIVGGEDRVAVVIPDGTRAMPLNRLLPWLFDYLGNPPAERVVIINGTGTHRANTDAELRHMLGDAVFEAYRVVNHNAADFGSHVEVGNSMDGLPVRLERAYVEADKRIVLGFIEPHFWAGFSGGYKGVFPAIADLDSINHYHRPSVVADPRSTWGRIEENPTQGQVRHNGALCPPDFLINVTLNRRKAITGYFCGETDAAHQEGCRFARSTAMIPCDEPFPVVLTSNSGFPLDQNLYQAIKGMSAAAQIVRDGGLILAAAECRDGFPDHGNFKKVLFEESSPEAIIRRVEEAAEPFHDQWQVQIAGLLLKRARIALKSCLPSALVKRAHMEPVDSIEARLRQALDEYGADAPIAVLPEGPQTIPYLRSVK